MARVEGVGAAFCGGGFRSFAEVAAIEDMERNGVRIGAAAGTSMGSIVAVLVAAGLPSSRIEELLVEMDREVVQSGMLRNMQLKVLNMVANSSRWPTATGITRRTGSHTTSRPSSSACWRTAGRSSSVTKPVRSVRSAYWKPPCRSNLREAVTR